MWRHFLVKFCRSLVKKILSLTLGNQSSNLGLIFESKRKVDWRGVLDPKCGFGPTLRYTSVAQYAKSTTYVDACTSYEHVDTFAST